MRRYLAAVLVLAGIVVMGLWGWGLFASAQRSAPGPAAPDAASIGSAVPSPLTPEADPN